MVSSFFLISRFSHLNKCVTVSLNAAQIHQTLLVPLLIKSSITYVENWHCLATHRRRQTQMFASRIEDPPTTFRKLSITDDQSSTEISLFGEVALKTGTESRCGVNRGLSYRIFFFCCFFPTFPSNQLAFNAKS